MQVYRGGFMNWLWISLLILFMFSFSIFLKKANYNNQRKIDNCVIKHPYWYVYIGFFGVIGFNLIGLIFLIEQKEIYSWFCMLLLSVPYIFVVLFAKNWKVEFDDISFTFTNTFKVKSKYFYNQIKVINTGKAVRVFYEKRKIFTISTLIINVDEFEKKFNNYIKKNNK